MNDGPSSPSYSTYEYRTTAEDRRRGYCVVFGKKYPLRDGQLAITFPIMWDVAQELPYEGKHGKV